MAAARKDMCRRLFAPQKMLRSTHTELPTRSHTCFCVAAELPHGSQEATAIPPRSPRMRLAREAMPCRRSTVTSSTSRNSREKSMGSTHARLLETLVLLRGQRW